MDSRTCANKLGSYQKWFIGKDIREILLANDDLTDMVGQNIYPLIAPEKTDGDFILYRRDTYQKSWTKMGIVEDDCRITITAVADDYDDAMVLAALIDNTLTGYHSKTDGIKFTANLVDSNEVFDDNKYIETLIFEIK